MIYCKGDLLQAPQLVLAHQVNCRGVMSAGLARQIRERWPQVYKEYRTACDIAGSANLGTVTYVDVGEHWIANMHAQDSYGRAYRHTNYEAFACCCESLARFLKARELSEIAFPKYIGCGLGGGDWAVVKAIIESCLGKFEVYLYGL